MGATVFRPRYAFVPRTPVMLQIWGELKQKEAVGPTLSALLKHSQIKKKFDATWIYAELNELGELVKTIVSAARTALPATMFTTKGAVLPLLPSSRVPESVLRVFVYGGSLSTYLLRKTTRYLPVTVDADGGAVDPKDMQTFVSGPPWVLDALSKYHSALYASSGNMPRGHLPEPPPFYTVYRSYNEMAWLTQHRSSFSDAREYAECLADHHQP